jgi:hypothetical protein
MARVRHDASTILSLASWFVGDTSLGEGGSDHRSRPATGALTAISSDRERQISSHRTRRRHPATVAHY